MQSLLCPGKSLMDYAQPRNVNLNDCYFYHTVELPELGLISGEWDIRGREAAYVGGIDLRGKRVLEIGSASGHLCFWMEKQGAEVVAYDLDDKHEWDIVPYKKAEVDAVIEQRKQHLRRINNSWWLSHQKYQSNAKMAYGSVYDLNDSLGDFDIVTVKNMLLHVRDPFLALHRAASLARDRIVVTELTKPFFFWNQEQIQPQSGQLYLQFLPRADRLEPIESWWFLPTATIVEILKILGFQTMTTNLHKQTFRDGQSIEFCTIVGQR
ncbi:MAG: methyltransferase domain-containing protein [Rhodoplanes sp.]|uniref:class I SAM-dependent methyltransferase n=1 Tax=Rhodoplanes sp. TaxID=1968906 RepID=UPI001834DD17|nr:methyltransferase domain-containing protein [Rhodoplanes sp.]NVO17983.1 methyltransferase domain-containing protein [Rhodoplanes sp.]